MNHSKIEKKVRRPATRQFKGMIFIFLATAFMCAQPAHAGPAPRPKSAGIVAGPGSHTGLSEKTGNVKIVFTDGTTTVLTKDGSCLEPKVSATGAVAWIHFKGLGGRDNDLPMNEMLQARLPDGKTGEYKPESNGDALFIEKWNFADGGASVVMKTRSYHGPASITKFDLKSGKITGRESANKSPAELPAWARPYSDDD